jgi:hypothetical protein
MPFCSAHWFIDVVVGGSVVAVEGCVSIDIGAPVVVRGVSVVVRSSIDFGVSLGMDVVVLTSKLVVVPTVPVVDDSAVVTGGGNLMSFLPPAVVVVVVVVVVSSSRHSMIPTTTC